MNRGEIRGLVRRLLNETEPSASFWTDDQLNAFIQAAYEQLVTEAELMHCQSDTPSIAGVADYQIPMDALLVLYVWYDGGEALGQTSPEELHELDPAWVNRVCDPGTKPTHWFSRGQMFRLYPSPAESGKTITVWAIQSPRKLTEDAQTPEIQEPYHTGIAFLAAYLAAQTDYTNQLLRAASRDWLVTYQRIAQKATSFTLRREVARWRLRDVRERAPRAWQL